MKVIKHASEKVVRAVEHVLLESVTPSCIDPMLLKGDALNYVQWFIENRDTGILYRIHKLFIETESEPKRRNDVAKVKTGNQLGHS